MNTDLESLYHELGELEQAEFFAIEAGLFDRLPGIRAKQAPLQRAINEAEGREIYPSYQPADPHKFVVEISGCTHEQAEQVLRERLGHDEDYGFPYSINY
jgi:hypothetical protein